MAKLNQFSSCFMYRRMERKKNSVNTCHQQKWFDCNIASFQWFNLDWLAWSQLNLTQLNATQLDSVCQLFWFVSLLSQTECKKYSKIAIVISCHVCCCDVRNAIYKTRRSSKIRNWKFFALLNNHIDAHRYEIVGAGLCFNWNCKSPIRSIIYENFHLINNSCLLTYH